MSYHINSRGEVAPCRATKRTCRYGAEEHFPTGAQAEQGLTARHGALPTHKSTISLPSNVGTYTGRNGDLSQEGARVALATGLCGALALALHRRDGRPLYFLTYNALETPESFQQAFKQDPAYVLQSTHVMAGSTTAEDAYCDAYGHRTEEDFEEYYGEITIVEASPAMVEAFAGFGEAAPDLSAFAQSAAALDAAQEGYSYAELEAYSDEEDDEEDYEDDELSEEEAEE